MMVNIGEIEDIERKFKITRLIYLLIFQIIIFNIPLIYQAKMYIENTEWYINSSPMECAIFMMIIQNFPLVFSSIYVYKGFFEKSIVRHLNGLALISISWTPAIFIIFVYTAWRYFWIGLILPFIIGLIMGGILSIFSHIIQWVYFSVIGFYFLLNLILNFKINLLEYFWTVLGIFLSRAPSTMMAS